MRSFWEMKVEIFYGSMHTLDEIYANLIPVGLHQSSVFPKFMTHI